MSRTDDWNQAITDFLAHKRIAVIGVSRTKSEAANAIYRKLRTAGYEVFAVNPSATSLEGDTCYPRLAEIPNGADAAVIATHPDVAPDVVRDCVEAGVRHIWMHRSFGSGSYSEHAERLARDNGISVIPGGCPMMFLDPVDVGHKCIRWFLRLTGGLPKAA